MKQRLLNILFWSVISAAFIGPGTVTTAASAGAGFGYALIWALVFSTVACYVLQEASARITTVSGMNLGQAMHREYKDRRSGRMLIWLALISIVSGCAAFEAGNILGAAAGITLLGDYISTELIVILIGLLAALILWDGNIARIAKLLGVIVAVMGICFVITAVLISHDIGAIFSKGFVPGVPFGSELLVLGLIGTTVVPYNIFLGSGLKHTQSAAEMKLSLAIAIGLGGFVSVAILLTGTAISGAFTFEALAAELENVLGPGASYLLAAGLFGAGLSSALTAALAAAITAKSILGTQDNEANWSETSIRFRSVWGGVLVFGIIFGFLKLQPVPVIILAQALNGIILPVIAVILFLLMNNDRILPAAHQNSRFYNILTGLVVYMTVLIGLTNVMRAASRAFEFMIPGHTTLVLISLLLFFLLMIPVLKKVARQP